MDIQANNRRYRMQDWEARRIGITPNKSKRYRLTKLQEEKYLGLGIKRLFFDIETTPNVVYSWRVGGKIYIDHNNIIEERKIICISYKWERSNEVYTIKWDNNQDDKKMIAAFLKIANKADELVAHNGDRFDIRWLRARAVYHRLPMFPNYRTLDTLKKVRNRFYFNSNRLDYLAKYLGVGAKSETEGFDMWIKVMQGDDEALKNMISYCENDVIILEDVFSVLQPYIIQNTNASA